MMLRQSRPPLLTELHIVAAAWGLGFRAEVRGLGGARASARGLLVRRDLSLNFLNPKPRWKKAYRAMLNLSSAML